MHGSVTLNFKTNRFCFLRSKVSRSRLSSGKRFLFPVIAFPLAEKTRSTGAVEAGHTECQKILETRMGINTCIK